ncbi:Suppressor of presenilin protein 4 [Toxocara canis]|uniref:Suppressor of presenilin protein 4 n=1 Tax=Toxocara canis TaxID=6265 RepID=A0A0B2W4A6_TOXCA|nr:Suppressor of presenilin protein 4 [Toxocara canis]
MQLENRPRSHYIISGWPSFLAGHRAVHATCFSTESKMDKIIVVRDLDSMEECEVLYDSDVMLTGEDDHKVDRWGERNASADWQSASEAERRFSRLMLNHHDEPQNGMIGIREVKDTDGETKGASPLDDMVAHLRSDDESFEYTLLKLLHRIRQSYSSLLNPSGNVYRCAECPFTCDDEIVFAFHGDRHKARDGCLKCIICSYRVHTKEALCNHLTVHTKMQSDSKTIASFRKRRCGKTFTLKSCAFGTPSVSTNSTHCLQHAMQIQRKLELSIKRNKFGDEQIKNGRNRCHSAKGQLLCWKCSFYCDDQSTLGGHMELHGLAAPFICSLCDYASFSKEVLHCHQTNHHLDVPLTDMCRRRISPFNINPSEGRGQNGVV